MDYLCSWRGAVLLRENATAISAAAIQHLAKSAGNPQRRPPDSTAAARHRLHQRASAGRACLFELARIANLSPHPFATVFKASTGVSPHRYVIERRIDRARDLLRQDEKTISEIAYAVGLSSQSHLTANFRRTTGVTPRKFRQSCIEAARMSAKGQKRTLFTTPFHVRFTPRADMSAPASMSAKCQYKRPRLSELACS